MQRWFKRLQSLSWMIIIPLLIILLWQSAAPAQTSRLDSRVARLENENSQLRSRIGRLETQISRLGRGAGLTAPAPLPEVRTSDLANDPMFERLATLVIETRERVSALEERLAGIEARLPPT